MNSDMVLYEKILDTPGFAFHFNELVKIALIEHGPEVSREFVEKYANRISIATTWNGQNVRILKRAFREAGVTVKEKK